jgi:hypothetical protein
MSKIQLTHPEGKKAPTMDAHKYDTLSTSFLSCLTKIKTASFDQLQEAVEQDLKKRKVTVEGKLGWNLFWVTLDLESKHVIKRDKKVSPQLYTLT